MKRGQELYTIKDIAKFAGVSCSTVSRVINEKSGVNSETRMHVLKICNDLGFVPNAIARGLVSQHTKTLGIILSDLTNPFLSERIANLEAYAAKSGYSILIANANWNLKHEQSYCKLFLEKQVEGLIIAPVSSKKLSYLYPHSSRIPIVLLGGLDNEERLHSVLVNNYLGGYKAARHLLGLGHKRVAFVGGNIQSSTFQKRLEGFQKAFEEQALKFSYDDVYIAGYSQKDGHRASSEFLASKRKYSAVFAFNDLVAMGILQALYEQGIKVPDDISLVGFDNISYGALPGIELTTLEQPIAKLDKAAVEIVIEGIENPEKNQRRKLVELPPTLICRSTTRKINA